MSILKKAAGISTAGIMALHVAIVPWEGEENVVYPDHLAGGLPTVCSGVTGWHLKIGDYYTNEQCAELNAQAVAKHEAGLRAALTYAPIPDETMAAFISWTYNVGVAAAKRSTLVRKANRGDLEGACNELSRWVYASGKVVRGLENRRFRGDAHRVSERSLCLSGLKPSYETPLLERWFSSYQTWLRKLFASSEDYHDSQFMG